MSQYAEYLRRTAARLLEAIYSIPLPHAPQFKRFRSAYRRYCQWKIPGWINFAAECPHRPGGETAEMLAINIGRRLRPAWPAWTATAVISLVAMFTVLFAAVRPVPAHAATAARAAQVQTATIQQNISQIASFDDQVAAQNAALKTVPHGNVQLLVAGVSKLPSASRLGQLATQYSTLQAQIAAAASNTYSTPYGLSAFEACVISREDPQHIVDIMNSSQHFGLFQFSLSTWETGGGTAASFGYADEATQQQVFNYIMANPGSTGGANNWTPYDGCVYSGAPVLTASGGSGLYPLRSISGLVVGRIDEGQDFCGSGPLYAVGTGVIKQVYGNWPGGIYILEYVTSGGASGRYVYFAESIDPTVSVGEQVNSSTEVGYMYNSPTCIEIGWGTSTESTPAAWGHYVEGQPTAEGYSMQAFLASLR